MYAARVGPAAATQPATCPLVAKLAHPRMAGRSVVAIPELKHLLSLGGVHVQTRGTGAMRGRAFVRREVRLSCWQETRLPPDPEPSLAWRELHRRWRLPRHTQV